MHPRKTPHPSPWKHFILSNIAQQLKARVYVNYPVGKKAISIEKLQRGLNSPIRKIITPPPKNSQPFLSEKFQPP